MSHRLVAGLALGLLLLWTGGAGAEESSGRPEWLDWRASLTLAGVANLSHQAGDGARPDQRGLSELSGRLEVEALVRLGPRWRFKAAGEALADLAPSLKGRSTYPESYLAAYETEAVLGETYLQGLLADKLELKVGRQVALVGKLESLRVVDVINPLDLRRPGYGPVRPIRLPLTMTRLDWFAGPLRVTGAVIHEPRWTRLPTLGSDFYPPNQPLPPDPTPAINPDNQQYLLALGWTGRRAGLTVMAASVFDDLPHAVVGPEGMRLSHARLRVLGLAGETGLGPWLFRAEAAALHGFKFAVQPEARLARLDLGAGVEYAGLARTNLAVEALNRHLFNFRPALAVSPEGPRQDDFAWAFRLVHDLHRHQVVLTLLAGALGFTGQGGAFEQVEVRYEWRDGLAWIGGLSLYQSGDRAYTRTIDRASRLYLGLRLSLP